MTDEQKRAALRRWKMREQSNGLRQTFEAKASKWKKLRERCDANEKDATRLLMKVSDIRHLLPAQLHRVFDLEVDLHARIALATVEIPDFNSPVVVRKRQITQRANSQPVPATEKRRARSSSRFNVNCWVHR